MRKAVYIDGSFAQSVDVDADAVPELPEGVDLYDFPDPEPVRVRQPAARIETKIVEDHDRKVRRIVLTAVQPSDIERAARLQRDYGGALLIAELLTMKNEIRALRDEPALTMDEYLAELAGNH